MALTQEQINAVARHRKKKSRQLKKFKSPEPPKSIAADYAIEMRRLTNEITDLVAAEILPLLEEFENQYRIPETVDVDIGVELAFAFNRIEQKLESQSEKLDKYAKRIARKSMLKGNRFHRKKWVAQINKLAGIDVRSLLRDKNIEALLLDKINENVALIKTLQPEYLDQVQQAVTEGMRRGDDFFSIRQRLGELESKNSRYRPQLIARDQMSKLTGDLNMFRQQDIGIRAYIWRTVGDSAVRPLHKANDGKQFSWAAPPPSTGHPGHDINCRCVAEPVFDEWLASIDRQKSWDPN
ncbi:hypothetical protein GWN42_13640 [candidate division KSB1 bacterium]|nr:hypothetical protein [candidate division KSB1 bacterium]